MTNLYAGDPVNQTDPTGNGFWDVGLHVGLTAVSTLNTLAFGRLALTTGVTCELASVSLAVPLCAVIAGEFGGVAVAEGYVAVNEWSYWFV